MLEPTDQPPIATSPVSVILVVADVNAEADEVLNGWITFLNGFERDYELLLVSARADTSLESLAGRCARARAVPPAADGFGVALGAGLRAATHPLVCYTTCDRRFQPKDLKQLLKLIDKAHLVCGRRVVPAGVQATWRDRAFRWLVRMVFAIRLTDVDCPYVLARRSIFARIPIQSAGSFAHVEVMAKANFLSCLMADAAVEYRPGAEAVDRQWRADFRRVYSAPDFGPAVLASSP